MSKEPLALSTVPLERPAQGDYDAICAAVMRSARGRWFLDEFARRNRNADTRLLLDAIERIEAVIRGDRSREAFQSFRVGLLEMAKAIAETRAEVAGIKSEPATHGRLAQPANPAASPSPDVFAAAERIQDVVWAMRERGLDPAMCEQIETLATSILSASSLRDPSSNRAQKLGEVLQSLERRINTMLDDVADAEESAQAPFEALPAEAAGEEQSSSTGNGHDPRPMQAAAAEPVPAPSDATMQPPGGPAPSAAAELELDPIKVELPPAPAISPAPPPGTPARSSNLEAGPAIVAERLPDVAEAAPAAHSSELSGRPPEQSAGSSKAKAAVVVDLDSLALAIDIPPADSPAGPIASEHEPPASSVLPAHEYAQLEPVAAAKSESPPATADAMVEIERDLFAADAQPAQEISHTAPPAQPLPESSWPAPVEQASQPVPPPAVGIAMTVTAAVPVQVSSGPQPWEADLIPALPDPPPAGTAAAMPEVDLIATAVAAPASLAQPPARPVAKPAARFAPSDPLAAFKAMSDEERIALFS